MEIEPLENYSDYFNKFKIDLIVWKFDEKNINKCITIRFKIDLIVWKYKYSYLMNRIAYCLKQT